MSIDLSSYGLVPHSSKTVKPGDVFGRLTILAIGKPPGSYRYTAICRCECGKEARARLDGITRGAVVSCGCYHKESIRTHGLSRTPIYNSWRNMIDRCTNPENSAFANYGGRGIRVCDRWQSVVAFHADMHATHFQGAEIDRVNNDGNYEPTNCRWVSSAINCDNRRTGRKVTFNGKTQSIKRWAQELGINYGTLWTRIVENGWSAERALTTPPIDKDERMARARAATARGF